MWIEFQIVKYFQSGIGCSSSGGGVGDERCVVGYLFIYNEGEGCECR